MTALVLLSTWIKTDQLTSWDCNWIAWFAYRLPCRAWSRSEELGLAIHAQLIFEHFCLHFPRIDHVGGSSYFSSSSLKFSSNYHLVLDMNLLIVTALCCIDECDPRLNNIRNNRAHALVNSTPNPMWDFLSSTISSTFSTLLYSHLHA